MSSTRLVTFVVGASLVAVWMAAAAGACFVRDDTAAAPDAVSRAAPTGGAPAPILRPYQPPGPDSSRAPARNLFETRGRPAAAPVAPPRPRPEREAVPATLDPAPGPPVSLAGIAASGEGASLVRTAVVSSAGELWLAREGAIIAGRYRVERIGADEVEIQDTVLHVRQVLRLR